MEPTNHPSLPPELNDALLEFAAWSQEQLLIDQRKSTPKGPLYHYTDETALRGILSTQRLWCFSHLHQTDHEEFAYSLGVAREVIKTVRQNGHWVGSRLCEFLDDILEANSFTGIFEFFLFSFSRLRDDRKQWQEYGRQGQGSAIGFAPALFQPTQADLNEAANENNFVGLVRYGDFATSSRHRMVIERAAKIASRRVSTNSSWENQGVPTPYFVEMAKEIIARQLIWNCLTAKREKYSAEQEVRFVVMN
jgi:hypothetical protein